MIVKISQFPVTFLCGVRRCFCIPGWPHTAQADRAPMAPGPPALSGRAEVEPSASPALQNHSASPAPGSPLAPCTPPQAGCSAEWTAWEKLTEQTRIGVRSDDNVMQYIRIWCLLVLMCMLTHTTCACSSTDVCKHKSGLCPPPQ